MWETIDLKYGILAKIYLFLQQLKQCLTKGNKKKIVKHNQECKIIIEGYLQYLVNIKDVYLY